MKKSGKTAAVLSLIILIVIAAAPCVAQQVTFVPVQVYFGRIPAGTDADHYSIIYNISTSNLNITNLTLSGTDEAQFSFVDNPGQVTLAPVGKLIIDLRFHPNSTGDKSAYLVVESNAPSSPDSVLLSGVGLSQAGGAITFERVLGHPDGETIGKIALTDDGGLIIPGSLHDNEWDWPDARLIKTDRRGQVEWVQTYGSQDNSEKFVSVLIVNDGFIAVGSKTTLDDYDENLYIVKTDFNGQLLWTQEYSFQLNNRDRLDVIKAAGINRYLVAGMTSSIVQGQKRGYFMLIDENGDRIRGIDLVNCEGVNSVQQLSDSEFIFTGSTRTLASGGSGDTDIYLAKIDTSLNILWEKAYGTTGAEVANAVILNAEGDIIIAGYQTSQATATNAYVIKTNAQGDKDAQWGDKVFGDVHHDRVNSIIEVEDGYILAGYTENYYDSDRKEWMADLYILKCDFLGNEVWTRAYGGLHNESAKHAVYATNGEFFVGGTSVSYSKNPDPDLYLFRLNDEGMTTSVLSGTDRLPETFTLDQNYPNPFNPETRIEFTLERMQPVRLTIYDLLGKRVKTLVDDIQNAGVHQVMWNGLDENGRAVPSGMYFYRLNAGQRVETRKMMLVK